MFGLVVKEPYVAYVGWRALYDGFNIQLLADRTSTAGSAAATRTLIKWANRGRPSPWKAMLAAAKYELTRTTDKEWQHREDKFVLRCNPLSSHGYLYIALFELEDTAETEEE